MFPLWRPPVRGCGLMRITSFPLWRPPVRGCGLDDLKFVPSVWGSAQFKPPHRTGTQPCERTPSAQSEHTVTRKYKKTGATGRELQGNLAGSLRAALVRAALQLPIPSQGHS